jgi:uncharacterized protein
MNNSLFSKFGPKEPKFFDFLKQVSSTLMEASDILMEALESTTGEERKEYFHRIKEKERIGDALVYRIFERLGSSFITPFDREDIHLLANNLDDVIDRINSCAKRIAIYNPKKNNPYQKKLGEIVRKDAECIDAAMVELVNVRKNAGKLKDRSKTLHDLENEGDDVYETAIIHLFEEEKDGIELTKVKEILNELEKATDAAEQVGKSLRTIIVKYA